MGIITATCVKSMSWNHVTEGKRERKARRGGRRLRTRGVDTNDDRDFDRRANNGPMLKMENKETSPLWDMKSMEGWGTAFTWTKLMKEWVPQGTFSFLKARRIW